MSCNWSRGAVLVHQVSDSWIPVSGRHSQARLDPCYPLWEAQGTPSQRTGVCKPWHRDLCWSKESNLTGLSTPYLIQRCADMEISELAMELIEQSLKKVYIWIVFASLCKVFHLIKRLCCLPCSVWSQIILIFIIILQIYNKFMLGNFCL